MSDYTLLTGSTGLLGRYLLRDLLLAGERVAIVARASQKETVEQRIESILQPWEAELGVELPRPVCFEGDLCLELLGLDEIPRQWIAEHCTSMLHSAAALKFHEEDDGEPWRTNVGGTRNVLQLCRDTGIKKIHYVSTAYVCGMRTDLVKEDICNLGLGFRNDYEKSKLEAETMIREDTHFDEVTVYRPAVIAGDSKTGYTNTYHGLYMYLKLMCIFARNTEPGPDGVRHTPMQLDTTGEEPRNVIPVDWTAAVIAHLFTNPESHGRTFHLAPRVRMTARQMVEAGYTYFNSTGVEFVGREGKRSEEVMEKDFYDNATMYRSYEDSDPEFDTTNTQKYASHLPCPEIDEAMLHRFMKYGEEDRWGKRRPKFASVSLLVRDYLTRLNSEKADAGGPDDWVVGLEVSGAGGGQWTLVFSGVSLVAFDSGIGADCSAILKMTSGDFQDFALARGNQDDMLLKLARHLEASPTDLPENLPRTDLSRTIVAGLFSQDNSPIESATR